MHFLALEIDSIFFLHKGKQIMLRVITNNGEFIFIGIHMCSKLTSIRKFPFENHGTFEYRLENSLQNKGSTPTIDSRCLY